MSFYKFTQNNSFGHFEEDDKVCQFLYIEADNIAEAIYKAGELGCYWDGVKKGIDCPCCGDRWNIYGELISPEKPISTIEEYAQLMADKYGGFTKPDARIFYEDGRIVEIFQKTED